MVLVEDWISTPRECIRKPKARFPYIWKLRTADDKKGITNLLAENKLSGALGSSIIIKAK